jgi:DNA-binding NtrC family response regulator
MGIDVSDISASAWRDAQARWSTWRPVMQLALDRAVLHGGEMHNPSSTAPLFSFSGFVHESASMRSIAQRIHRMRASHSPVLITGERGAGKTTVARAIHETSERHEGPWRTIDCGGIAPEPMDARLFGHPSEDTSGLLRQADGGTLLIQSIDALPLDTQAKLLQALNAGELFAPGTDAPMPVDVRILASSAENLNALVRAGRFRRDLYHRLHVISVHVPPLHERPADIPALARHFATTLAPAGTPPVSITTRALDALRHYHWPGNVRQLRNTIDRAIGLVASEPAPTIDRPMLPDPLQAQASTIPAQDGWAEILRPDCSLDDVLARTEKEIIERVLAECEGQITASADILGLTRQGLYKKMKRLSIDPASFKQNVPSSALAS